MTETATYEVDCAFDGNCGTKVWSPDEFNLMCWVTWHVYEEHPDVWLTRIGDVAPTDPKPDPCQVFPGNPSQERRD